MSGTTKLLTLEVKAGNTVKAGQVLATIDPASYKQALDRARSDLLAAEEKLADLKTPATELEIARADLAIAKAELMLWPVSDRARGQARQTLDDLLNPDIPALQAAVADARSTLAKAQADLAALQNDTTTEDKLSKLRDTEAKAAAEYARLANETYSDAYHQDRVQVAYNAMMNAQDARITAEVQQKVNLLNAQMQVRKARETLADLY
jgi:HlyD family secretion protein